MRAYHFVGTTLRHTGPLVLCESGFHASLDPFDALAWQRGVFNQLVEEAGI